MIRKNDIYSWLSILAMLPMVLTACLEEDNYKQCPNQTDKIQLTISLPEQTRIATNTRAVSKRVDYSIVNNLNIVLATHSPYFMNALQVYSAKHEIADKTKYYLAELNEEGRAVFDDVTLDPERVYKLLAQPFQILADEEEQE